MNDKQKTLTTAVPGFARLKNFMRDRLPSFFLGSILLLLQVSALVLLAFLLWQCGLSICPFRLLTGLPCLCCGMTHAWIACMQGNFAQAFQYHPCFLVAVPAFLTLIAQRHAWGKKLWQSRLYWASLLLILAACYLWRMLKCFPNGQYPMTWIDKNLLSMLFRATIPP